jgi:hypothetical protein
MDDQQLAVWGLVLEEDLSDVETFSVGQVRVAGLTLSYHGTQQLTHDHAGTEVYGGSDLHVVRGDYQQLLQLPLEDHLRLAINQAMTYEQAAERHFPGFIASRRNYDIARGTDPHGHLRSGVLEQSWRPGGPAAPSSSRCRPSPTTRPCSKCAHQPTKCSAKPDSRPTPPSSIRGMTVNSDNSANMHGSATMTIESETIELAVEGECIAGTLVSPGSKMPGILFVHGWGGSQQRDLARARQITGLGCVCMTFDLRGHEKTAKPAPDRHPRAEPRRPAGRLRPPRQPPRRRPRRHGRHRQQLWRLPGHPAHPPPSGEMVGAEGAGTVLGR